MTRDELLTALRALAVEDGADCESDHAEADTALLVYINDPEIADAYNAIEKWYA